MSSQPLMALHAGHRRSATVAARTDGAWDHPAAVSRMGAAGDDRRDRLDLLATVARLGTIVAAREDSVPRTDKRAQERMSVPPRAPEPGDAATDQARAALPASARRRPPIWRTAVARSQRRLYALLGADPRLVRVARRLRMGADELGPGLITGVADDDPSGISTYTVTGATFGYQLLWLSLVTFPMNFAVQSICARIGLVTGRGLAGVIRARYGRRWLAPIVLLLLVANVVNIGADLHAIAAVVTLLTGVPTVALVAPLGIAVALMEIVVPYALFARYLKALTLVIFAYVIGAFVARPDWPAALTATVVPRLALDRTLIATVVAILGTTISPYLFFWQAAEEVEEEHERGIVGSLLSTGEMGALLAAARVDVATGMGLANVGFYFVVLTSAATLHASGQTEVQTAAQAAEALRPLAGPAASLVFALGIIGTGLLAVPVLAGSVAYATAELFDWPEGLANRFRQAPQFYAVIALATLLGGALSVVGVSEIHALYVAAIVNGVIAPALLLAIMRIARDRRVLGDHIASRSLAALGWGTTLAMAAAALAFVATLR